MITEIQQARETAERWTQLEYSTGDEDADRDFFLLARAVLALTDELAAANATINTKLHLSDLTDAWEGDVMSPATQRFLAGPQPEPVTRDPHVGNFYDQFCREVEAQHIASDLPAAAVVGICTRMAHKAQRKVIEQQPEPVSQDELGALVIRWWTSEHAIHVLTRELLSQYAITRKPQRGA